MARRACEVSPRERLPGVAKRTLSTEPYLFLFSLGVLLLSGFAALLIPRPARAARVGAAGAIAGCLLGLAEALARLAGGEASTLLRFTWAVPDMAFTLQVDALSAAFLAPLFLLGAAAALYSIGYFAHEDPPRAPGAFWFWMNLLIASMALVLTARHGVAFLVLWEIMTIASFFLVAWDSGREDVRRASLTYLVASHLGVAFLLLFFLLLRRETGSFDFPGAGALAAPGAGGAGQFAAAAPAALFLLALLGFGTKAGLAPLHVWLPEAHPAAPSPVSALMSGALIKTGVYGFLRALGWLGAPPAWWGWLLLGLGALTALGGAAYALAQSDLKRLLAYSSIENIGLIFIGIGLGLMGRAVGAPAVAALGFAAAILHAWNHSLAKGLLFLGAGSAVHATGGERDLNRFGGLLKRMPWTGACFLAGAAALAGLPPLNGFIGEFLTGFAALSGAVLFSGSSATPLVPLIAALALVAGLAVAVFARAFGIAFLGEPRSETADAAREAPLSMRAAMAALVALCFASALAAPWILIRLAQPLASLAGYDGPTGPLLRIPALSLCWVAGVGLALLALVGLFAALRAWRVARHPRAESVTWDCGYLRPTARMQYTGGSFAQPLMAIFGGAIGLRAAPPRVEGLFPAASRFTLMVLDRARDQFYLPLFTALARLFARARAIQQGRVQVYLLYIVLTLLVLLMWRL